MSVSIYRFIIVHAKLLHTGTHLLLSAFKNQEFEHESTPKEVKDAEEAVYVLEQLWKNLELNITVKAHLLFEHGIEQFTSAVGGIADRVEDFIEKYHQKIK